MSNYSYEKLSILIKSITDAIGNDALDKNLADKLNTRFGPNSQTFKDIETACHAGIAAGDLCKYEAGGIKYGRFIKPAATFNNYAAELVHMDSLKGPHHRHPSGEVNLVMPIDATATFDQNPAGWVVYPADTAHYPTVSNGAALVLYLLPNGDIEFTGRK